MAKDPFGWSELFNNNKAVTEPNAAMREMARTDWQCYQAHKQEGFTDDQAMAILLTILSTVISRPDFPTTED